MERKWVYGYVCFKKLSLPPLLITARIARFNGEPQGDACQSRGRVPTSELELGREAPKIWQWSRAFKTQGGYLQEPLSSRHAASKKLMR